MVTVAVLWIFLRTVELCFTTWFFGGRVFPIPDKKQIYCCNYKIIIERISHQVHGFILLKNYLQLKIFDNHKNMADTKITQNAGSSATATQLIRIIVKYSLCHM